MSIQYFLSHYFLKSQRELFLEFAVKQAFICNVRNTPRKMLQSNSFLISFPSTLRTHISSAKSHEYPAIGVLLMKGGHCPCSFDNASDDASDNALDVSDEAGMMVNQP